MAPRHRIRRKKNQNPPKKKPESAEKKKQNPPEKKQNPPRPNVYASPSFKKLILGPMLYLYLR
jgi:hypothetical protein